MLEQLGELWKSQPDIRLGQLFMNLIRVNHLDVNDKTLIQLMFYTEDDEMLRMIRSYEKEVEKLVERNRATYNRDKD